MPFPGKKPQATGQETEIQSLKECAPRKYTWNPNIALPGTARGQLSLPLGENRFSAKAYAICPFFLVGN